jgi:hypothetical protein
MTGSAIGGGAGGQGGTLVYRLATSGRVFMVSGGRSTLRSRG